MRVLKVSRRAGGSRPAIEFRLHAHLTVVRGLDDHDRSWLVDTIGRLDGARSADVDGEIESSGILLPLDLESLDLLGVGGASDAVLDVARLVPPDDHREPPGHAEAPGEGNPPEGDAAEVVAPEPVTADPEPDPPAATRTTALQLRIESLRGRRQELEQLAGDIDVADLSGVAAALTAFDEAPALVPKGEAGVLADAWHDLEKDRKGLALGTTEEESAAIEAVRRAEDAVAAAEDELSRPHLDEDMVARIEAAHAAYIEASDKVDRRFGGGRARRQLAEAEAEEEQLLNGVGFDSWVDYLMSASKRTDDPEMTAEHAALEAAREELAVCRAELDAIPGAVGRRHRRARLEQSESELVSRVEAVLGREPTGEGVEADLRAITAPYEPVAEVAGLTAALIGAGLDDATSDIPESRLADKARQILASNARAERRRAELVAAIDALGEALTVLEAAAAEGRSDVPEMPRLPDMAEPPVAFVDVVESSAPMDTYESAEAAATAATPEAPPDESGEGTGAAEPEGSEDIASEDVAPEDAEPVRSFRDRHELVDAMHWEAMVAIAGARADGPAGQLPVVLDDPFAVLDPDESVDLMSRLVRLTDHVQMIVVTDRPEVADWAAAVGDEHAAILEVAR